MSHGVTISELTVAGLASQPGAGLSVTVSGTGLTTGSADIYDDGSWAKAGASPASSGNSTYTATAQDTYGRTASDTINLSLPSTINFQYDGNGNLTNDGRRVFQYDYENQLTNVYVAGAWKSEFRYDAFGRRRVRKEYGWSGTWTLTNEVRYVYDGMLVVQERNAKNLPQVSYTRGNDLSGSLQGAGGIGGLLARTDMPSTINPQPSTSPHSYYHCDGNGNITAMVNTNGAIVARYNYDPYGNLLGMSGPLAEANTYRFSSKEWHGNAGLYYYGFRFYEPNLQRWLNKDPIGEDGGVNLFQFTRNLPINDIDLFGLDAGGRVGPGFPSDGYPHPELDFPWNDGAITDQSLAFLDAAMWADLARGACSLTKAGIQAIARNIATREALAAEKIALDAVSAARDKVANAAIKRNEVIGKGIEATQKGANPATHAEQIEAATAELARSQAQLAKARAELQAARDKVAKCSK